MITDNQLLLLPRTLVIPFKYFSTLTNVNFDRERFPIYIKEAIDHREAIKATMTLQSKLPSDSVLQQSPADWFPQSYEVDYLEEEGKMQNSYVNLNIFYYL